MDWFRILLVFWTIAPIFHFSNISSTSCENLSAKCKCADHILDCSRANLTDLDRVIESPTADQSFFKIVNFSLNDLKILNHSFTAPFHKVESFDFSHNNLHTLENHNFVYNPNLKFLNLSHNSFHIIKKGQFAGLDSNLRVLNLSYNLLTSLESNTFFHLRNLEILDLRWNVLTRLDNGAFRSLKSLKVLNLDNNDLATVPCKMLTKLETLSLRSNRLTNMSILNESVNLRNLFLDGNPLETIQTNAFVSTPNITQISIKNMPHLKTMEKCAFCGLTSLKRLLLSGNRRLTKIESLTFGTAPLTGIDLSGNKLTTLPSDLVSWSVEHRVKLNIRHNPWNCDCQIKWIFNDGFREIIEDDPRCFTPKELRGESLKNLTLSDFDVQKCSQVVEGGKSTHRFRQPSYPKLFFSLAIVLVIAISILVLWILVWKRRKALLSDRIRAAKIKSKKAAEPYAYRNLMMMQEDVERQERTAAVEEDLVMNAACSTLEKTSGV